MELSGKKYRLSYRIKDKKRTVIYFLDREGEGTRSFGFAMRKFIAIGFEIHLAFNYPNT